ncbi:hypothetical protein L484_013131 [Morus notabilis]|uniref:CRAL-TRIO domain-containing protein n=1 Tax=Morus notabilis TaxID=981085 RepID=W9RJV3_9ROSA|nr:hypothetical protein L484_013131 [Morus notabilis]
MFDGTLSMMVCKCSRIPRSEEKFTSIADLQGWGYSNSDIRGYLAALSILQDCYPERLGKLFIVHSPYIFMTAWKMIYPFIDSNTKKKWKQFELLIHVNLTFLVSKTHVEIFIDGLYANGVVLLPDGVFLSVGSCIAQGLKNNFAENKSRLP